MRPRIHIEAAATHPFHLCLAVQVIRSRKQFVEIIPVVDGFPVAQHL